MREAVLTLTDDELETLGIYDLVAHCREAGLLAFDELECRGGGAVIQVEVEAPLDADRLDALEYVDWWERVAADAGRERYLVSFTTPAFADAAAGSTADLVGTCDAEVGARGATVSIVGSQDAIRSTIGEYETAGVSPGLRKLADFAGRPEPLDALTDRQREVIETAHGMGYYEVPRAATTTDVADELGVDPSTVTEHLQRAERNLLDAEFSRS